jgi:hypothetical protein
MDGDVECRFAVFLQLHCAVKVEFERSSIEFTMLPGSGSVSVEVDCAATVVARSAQ